MRIESLVVHGIGMLLRSSTLGSEVLAIWRAQAAVDGAVEVPIYIPETKWGVMNLLKQASNFGLGGWWLGGSHMIPNGGFLSEVQSKIPKDAKVIVACQKGLRWVQLSGHLFPTCMPPPDTVRLSLQTLNSVVTGYMQHGKLLY